MRVEQQRFQAMLAPSVQALGYELLGVQVSRGAGRTVLRLYIDSDAGITLEDCERVSQQASGVLDVEDPIQGEYDLEVSSPGADRPLFARSHFERYVGEQVRVRMSVPVSGRRNFTGTLRAMDGDTVVLSDDAGAEWRLSLAQIAIARLVA